MGDHGDPKVVTGSLSLILLRELKAFGARIVVPEGRTDNM